MSTSKVRLAYIFLENPVLVLPRGGRFLNSGVVARAAGPAELQTVRTEKGIADFDSLVFAAIFTLAVVVLIRGAHGAGDEGEPF